MRNVVWKSSIGCSELVAVLFFFGLLLGCSVTLPKPKTYEEAVKEVDARGPLVSATVEQREGYEDGKSEVIQKDQPAQYSGILMDEKKATKLAAIKAERDRRRLELEAVARKVEIQKIIYESQLDYMKAKLDARATWWERNKLFVGFGLGAVLGMAIVTGLTYGLTRGTGLSAGSTTQSLVTH